jgi:hypothetical protein
LSAGYPAPLIKRVGSMIWPSTERRPTPILLRRSGAHVKNFRRCDHFMCGEPFLGERVDLRNPSLIVVTSPHLPSPHLPCPQPLSVFLFFFFLFSFGFPFGFVS